MTQFSNSFSEEVWFSTYKDHRENDVDGTLWRTANSVASVEKTEELRKEWAEKFYDMLSDFKVTAGGRIYANAGVEFKGTTMINCFVGPRDDYDIDSLDGIMSVLRQQAQTLKSEGGWGMNFSFIRPRGSFIYGIGVETPGAVKYMEIFDKSSEIVTSGSGLKKSKKQAKNKIRKGAMMGVLDCSHPDIEEFITAKQTEGRLTKFNMSVNCFSEFMDKIIKIEELRNQNQSISEDLDKWDLVFPDTTFEKYKKEWDGNIKAWKEKGYPIIVYKTISAYGLWEKITQSTYNRNEPGVLFLDNANRTHAWNYGGSKCLIGATNPCLIEGTMVNTPNGYKKVESILVGENISTLHPIGYEPVKNIERHENIDVYKVIFSDGGEQIATAAHQYHVFEKGQKTTKFVTKKRLDQIKVGDSVQVCPIEIENNGIDNERFEKGLLAGILLGDGYYTERTMRTAGSVKTSRSQNDVEYNNNVKKLIEKMGYKCNESDCIDNNSFSMSMPLRKADSKILSDLNLVSRCFYEKEIPMEYINDYSSACGVINGLLATDGDVNIRSNHPQIRFFTTSPKMARQIRMLLMNLGVHGRITKPNGIDNSGVINGCQIERKHIKYAVNVSGFDFKKLAEICCKNINQDKANKILYAVSNADLSGNSRLAEILSIEQFGKGTVYDLYCEQTDSWITEGYVQRGCGEQALTYGGCCNLLSMNVFQFFDDNKRSFDFKKFEKYVKIAIRFADNVNDYSNAPLKEYKDSLIKRRRIGLGILGWASLLYMMKIRFASDAAEELKNKIMKTMTHAAVGTSIDLAIEKGKFEGCDNEKHAKAVLWDMIKLPEATRERIRRHGIRNSALFSIQPNGNTSCFANLVSSGIEPVFSYEYIRTVIVPVVPDQIKHVCPKYWEGEMIETDMFKWTKEGDEKMLKGTDKNGVVYKIDKNRGLTKEVVVRDAAYQKLLNTGEWDGKADWATTTMDLSVEDHIRDMAGWYNWIDSSISKTVNLPNDYPYEKFKKVYIDLYKSGVAKGMTTYRTGTMASVLSVKSEEQKLDEDCKINKTTPPKRSRSLEANVHFTTVQGKPYYVIVGMMGEQPYEVFTGTNSADDIEHFIPKKIEHGIVTKKSRGIYELTSKEHPDFKFVLNNGHSDDTADALTRMISTALRHGADISFIVHQLEKTQGGLMSFAKAVARSLKKYIPDGTTVSGEKCDICGGKLIRVEGCIKCTNCDFNRCS